MLPLFFIAFKGLGLWLPLSWLCRDDTGYCGETWLVQLLVWTTYSTIPSILQGSLSLELIAIHDIFNQNGPRILVNCWNWWSYLSACMLSLLSVCAGFSEQTERMHGQRNEKAQLTSWIILYTFCSWRNMNPDGLKISINTSGVFFGHSDPRPFHSPEKARGYQRIVFLHYNMLCCRMAGLWNLLQQSKQRVVLFQTRGPREWFNSLVFKWIMASPQPGIPGKVFSICIPIGALEEQDKALWHGLEFSVPLFLFSVWVHEWHRCYLARLFVVPSDFGSQLIQPMKPSCGSIPQR